MIQRLVDKRFAQLSEKYHYIVHEDVVEAAKKKAGGNAKTSEFTALQFENLDPADMELDLAAYDGGVIKLGELFEDRKKAPSAMRDFRERLRSIAEQHLFSKHAYEIGIAEEPEMQQEFKNAHDSHLRTLLYQEMVRGRIPALLDSAMALESENVAPEELRRFRQRKAFEIENGLKEKYEQTLKTKYHFKYISKNFKNALLVAKARKIEAVKEKQNGQSTQTEQE